MERKGARDEREQSEVVVFDIGRILSDYTIGYFIGTWKNGFEEVDIL